MKGFTVHVVILLFMVVRLCNATALEDTTEKVNKDISVPKVAIETSTHGPEQIGSVVRHSGRSVCRFWDKCHNLYVYVHVGHYFYHCHRVYLVLHGCRGKLIK